ncbi:hypothetical protein QVD17_03964 [Tagetes erecta]|uniref:Uncharacterized protein n=1 Tax=Tagetes erecta TaxID=13708 RepID=A0AAD8LFN8_TARER|nr:hypothetical protein QVD17_03964 [Tagetes erecta]
MAPLAHLAMYKVCFRVFCGDSAILAGMDAAIDDGVHVLSISLGGPSGAFYNGSLAVATFSAVQKGIFVSCSAGNSGPNSTSLGNEAPWILTVGASTINRRFRTSVLLGNKKLLHGESMYQPKHADHKLRPLIYHVKEGEHSAWCQPNSLDHFDVKGKVVLCDAGKLSTIDKGEIVLNAGGAAIIIANGIVSRESISAQANVIPASYVGYKEGVEIKNYLNSTSSPVATILCGGTVLGLKSDPMMAYFSSRGPNFASPGILKPDIIGPGVDILAAWKESTDNKKGTKETFNVISGTSMSCPHLAGVAALLTSAHSEWSPAAIKSAIMTTASQVNRMGSAIVDQTGLPADVFAIGSGHVYPQKAHDPGLVFDIQPDNYIPYLCGLGYTPKQVQIIVKKNVTCSETIPEAQLNYPSFSVSIKRGERKAFTRMVTNVGPANSSYTVGDVSVPKGVHVEFAVDDFEYAMRFTSVQQTKTLKVMFSRDANDKEKDLYGQGYMTLVSDGGKYTVRTPFSFKFE